ncbi:MAG: response regulator [Myxococcales bacterium]|nr:response regulator [Myxococcales bacterium]
MSPERRAKLERLKAARVVMVDDEPTTLDVLEMFLEAEGYGEITKISDPQQAIDRITALRPDVVLLNLMMPGVSGLDILTVMRADHELKTIPVLIITGSSDGELKRRALESGAADFLSKPVDPSELSLRLRNTLATRAYREGRTAPAGSMPAPSKGQPELDQRRVRFIMDTFLARLRPKLDEMDASVAQGDVVNLAGLAHWLKGAAGTVGLHAFTAPAERLGELVRAQRLDELPELMRTLRRLCDEAEADLAASGSRPC